MSMRYSDDIIEEVRSKNDIVDVVSQYVKLTRKGSSYFGLCPFHNEKTPSFSVTPGKQMYYCFGCGAGGNVFNFIMEYENYTYQHLGSVVTNDGYSDWATTAIPATVRTMWYRLSRRQDDYCIECSDDGVCFSQMRICHLHHGGGRIRFGIYASSPEASSFKAVFSHLQLTPCAWQAHDGQQPD